MHAHVHPPRATRVHCTPATHPLHSRYTPATHPLHARCGHRALVPGDAACGDRRAGTGVRAGGCSASRKWSRVWGTMAAFLASAGPVGSRLSPCPASGTVRAVHAGSCAGPLVWVTAAVGPCSAAQR